MYEFYSKNWPIIRKDKTLEDFNKNQGREVKSKMNLAIESIKVQFKQAGIPLESNPAQTQTVNTPTGQQTVNTNLTPDSVDRTLFSNAKLNLQTSFIVQTTVQSDGKFRVSGGITSTLTKEYEMDIFLQALNGQGTKIKVGTTILGKDGRFIFTTPSSFTRELDSTASANTDPDSREVYTYVQIKEYPEYKYGTVEVVIPFACPDYTYRIYDTIPPDEYKDILKDPCGECYPNGTGGSRIRIWDGKECT
jgi:hypothetical protein